MYILDFIKLEVAKMLIALAVCRLNYESGILTAGEYSLKDIEEAGNEDLRDTLKEISSATPLDKSNMPYGIFNKEKNQILYDIFNNNILYDEALLMYLSGRSYDGFFTENTESEYKKFYHLKGNFLNLVEDVIETMKRPDELIPSMLLEYLNNVFYSEDCNEFYIPWVGNLSLIDAETAKEYTHQIFHKRAETLWEDFNPYKYNTYNFFKVQLLNPALEKDGFYGTEIIIVLLKNLDSWGNIVDDNQEIAIFRPNAFTNGNIDIERLFEF